MLLLEWLLFGRRASSRVVLSIALVCAGVALSTLSEVHDVAATAEGVWIGAGAVAATALYQIWAGSKQRELGAGSMQLLHQYSPIAAAMLGTVTAVWEPIGLRSRDAEALLGYPFTAGACVAILLSALLGLLVSLSTFLVIGATSSLTYNVVGHIKTVCVLHPRVSAVCRAPRLSYCVLHLKRPDSHACCPSRCAGHHLDGRLSLLRRRDAAEEMHGHLRRHGRHSVVLTADTQ